MPYRTLSKTITSILFVVKRRLMIVYVKDSDTFSLRSGMSGTSTASTIAPEVIKARVKASLAKRNKKGMARRQVRLE